MAAGEASDEARNVADRSRDASPKRIAPKRGRLRYRMRAGGGLLSEGRQLRVVEFARLDKREAKQLRKLIRLLVQGRFRGETHVLRGGQRDRLLPGVLRSLVVKSGGKIRRSEIRSIEAALNVAVLRGEISGDVAVESQQLLNRLQRRIEVEIGERQIVAEAGTRVLIQREPKLTKHPLGTNPTFETVAVDIVIDARDTTDEEFSEVEEAVDQLLLLLGISVTTTVEDSES